MVPQRLHANRGSSTSSNAIYPTIRVSQYRRLTSSTAGTTDSSACSSVMLSIWGDHRSSASAAYPSLDARRPKRGTTRASARIGRSSSGIAASSTDATRFERFGGQLQFERFCQRHERRQRWVGTLGREKTPDHLGTKIGPARQLSLAQVEVAPTLVEHADDRVDLRNPSARCVVRKPVLRVILPTRQIPLCSRTCCHCQLTLSQRQLQRDAKVTRCSSLARPAPRVTVDAALTPAALRVARRRDEQLRMSGGGVSSGRGWGWWWKRRWLRFVLVGGFAFYVLGASAAGGSLR